MISNVNSLEFKNIDDEYESDTHSSRNVTVRSIRGFSFKSSKRNSITDDPIIESIPKVNYLSSKIVTIVQPNPKQIRANSNKINSNENNEMMSNDNESNDSKIDTISQSSNDIADESKQQQLQQSDKYNISNVLKHIYALKYQRNDDNKQTGSSKQFWMPDDQVKECFECNDKFTTFRRRHHCRVCGQIFCSKCSDYEIPSQLIWPNSIGDIRACTFCHSFVAQMETGDLKHNTKSIKELVKRLSLSSTFYSTFTQANSESTDNMSKLNQINQAIAETTSISSQSNSILFSNNSSTNSLSSPNTVFSNNNSPNLANNNTTTTNNINSQVNLSPVDDNNPFDIAENKDYFKSQDVEIKQLIINNSLELRNLWVQIYHTSDGLSFQTRNINKFKKINNCITGNELVEWLIRKKSVSRDQAIVIGQALCHGKWLECVYYNNPNMNSNLNNHHLFYDDNSYYKPGPTALNYNRNDTIFETKSVGHDLEEGPEWIKELNKLISTVDDEPLNSNAILSELEPDIQVLNDLESVESTQPLVIPIIKIENKAKVVDDAPFLSNLTIITGSTPTNSIQIANKSPSASQISLRQPTKTLNVVNDNLLETHKQLQIDLLKQLLKLKNISLDWFDIIMPIVWKCVDLVKPDVKHDNDLMDIRNYIKIKKLAGCDKTETRIVNGLVFTKNVAHKEMKKNLTNPKILLLRSSIEYQRTEEKMCSLEPILTAESQYLKNYCSKLLLRQNPEILIVEKSVARIAQEIFLQSNVSLILNVKSKIMDKLCRFLQADPMFSIDDLIRKPKLGICSKFYVENYRLSANRLKTLMFFEGTPTNLGCTVLLCGSSLNELSVIKSLTNFMIYVAYNSKLEHSFIIDKYADFEVKKSLYEAINEQEKFAEKTISKTQENDRPKKFDESDSAILETKTITYKKEISIDQSPLEEARSLNQSLDDQIQEDNKLKLTICNKHTEKNTFSLSRNFKLLLDDLILSCSPFVLYKPPFLINEININDQLIKYLPESYMNFLKSNILLKDTIASTASKSSSTNDLVIKQNETNENNIHEFLLMHLTKSFDNEEFKKLYADYKSRGGIAASLNSPKRLYLVESFMTGFDLNDKNETKTSKVSTHDCLDIFNRQHLAVLFYSQCETSPVFPNICNKPRVINMKYYSENDMTLGSFLVKNCFRNGYKCNNELCNTLIVYHTRTFVHSDSKITVRMSVVPSAPVPAPIAQLPSSPTPASNSSSSTNISNQDDKQQKPQQFSNLNVSDLLNASFSNGNSPNTQTNTSNLNMPTTNLTTVKSISTESLSKPVQQEPTLQQTVNYDEFNIYMWSVCKVCNKSTKKMPMSPDTWSFSFAKFLELTFYASNYHQFYNADDLLGSNSHHCCKHSLFQDHYQYFRFKNIVVVFSTSKINIRSLYLPNVMLKSNGFIRPRTEYIDEIKDLFEKGLVLFSTLVERICTLKTLNLNEKQMQKLDKYITDINNDQTLKHKIEKINLLLTNSSNLSINEASNPIDMLNNDLIDSFNHSDIAELSEKQKVNYDLIEMLLIDLRKYISNSAFNWNTKMTEFFKKSKFEDEGEVLNNEHGTSSNSVAIHKNTSREANSGKHGLSETSNEPGISNSLLESTTPKNETTANYLSQASAANEDDHNKQVTPTTMSIGKRFIANSFIANLIPSSVFQPLKVPFPDDEHYLLSSESTYYINDKNLSSIVAFSLSSKEYREFQINSGKNQNAREMFTQINEAIESDSVNAVSNLNKFHFEHQFHDSTTKFYCKAYYADLFSNLRKLIMPNEEEKYIHSLFRCMNWDAKGGKSNSQFRKTIDNRFVLKEMSKQEVQSFLDFAPQYVQYVTDSVQNKKATAVAKILGAYQICLMKNTTISSKAVKMDVIVLENLFYGKKLTQVFDLKGSERNRMVNVNYQSNKQQEKDLVLLDENFLRWSFDNPIYIKPHSKYVLMKAIEADSQFLSSKFVMDYSLLCGFDQVNDELVVGIIDYLRVFTWDKKVETYLKTISGQGKMPTIVSPEVYRKRFLNAIDRYFLAVPDQWYQESNEMNSN